MLSRTGMAGYWMLSKKVSDVLLICLKQSVWATGDVRQHALPVHLALLMSLLKTLDFFLGDGLMTTFWGSPLNGVHPPAQIYFRSPVGYGNPTYEIIVSCL